VDVDLTDGLTHDLELYFLDWDSTSRSEQVQISNAATGTVLATETVSSFHSGAYLEWAVSGNVLIKITKISGANAVLSGVFLDSATTPTPTPSLAAFVDEDSTTEGNWIGTYGTQGYDVIGNAVSLPSYATITATGESSSASWPTTTMDQRALQDAIGTSRIAAAWYSGSNFTVDVDLTDGLTHDLELYFLDWDSTSRSEQVQISNAATGTVLATETVSSFHSGAYLEWAVSGNVLIKITKISGANAVLSGVFLDPPVASNDAFVKSAAATPGNPITVSGIMEADELGTLNFTSIDSQAVSSATNPRALENVSSTGRIRRLQVRD